MNVRDVKYFHSWMDFPTIIRSIFPPEDQSKTAYICPWRTFPYRKLPFCLKKTGGTFHREMNCGFHDIKHIVQTYLDDLPAHSQKRANHMQHLRAIFLRFRHYKIQLNPHKFVFCVGSSCFLGSIVSKEGI